MTSEAGHSELPRPECVGLREVVEREVNFLRNEDPDSDEETDAYDDALDAIDEAFDAKPNSCEMETDVNRSCFRCGICFFEV